jgi:DNA-binding CsgD family transcriptional regulator
LQGLVTAPRSPFVGREHAVRTVEAALDLSREGRFCSVLVGGPAGIGKSRLLAHVVAGQPPGSQQQARSACAFVDAGEPQVASLEPIRELLSTPAFGSRQGQRDAPSGDDLLFASVRDAAPSGRYDGPLEVGVGRGREPLFREVADVIRTVADDAGLLVVTLENLQWADASTLDMIRFLARSLSDAPVALLATYRDGRDVTPQLRQLIIGLDRSANCSRLILDPLDREDIRTVVVHRMARTVDEATIDRIAERSEGVTLYVEELADQLYRHADDGVPKSLVDHFFGQFERLSPPARQLLDAAAVCGSRVGHRLLEAVAAEREGGFDLALDTLLDAGVLVVDTAVSGYRFRHELLHEAVLGELRPSAARQWHQRCARALTDRPQFSASAVDGRDAELARHWAGAGNLGEALAATRRAADRATEQRLYEEALRLDLVAIQQFDACRPEERIGLDRSHLLQRAAANADLAGDTQRMVSLLTEALTEVSDPIERARLQADLIRGRYLAGDPAGAALTAERALDEISEPLPPEVHARLVAGGAFRLQAPEVPGSPLQATSEGLALARRSGDPDVVCDLLSAHALAQAAAGDLAGARVSLAEAGALSGSVRDAPTALRPAVYKMFLLHRIGCDQEVVFVGREALLRADQLGVSRSVGQQVRHVLADALLAVGGWAEARVVIEDGLAWNDTGLAASLLLLTRAQLGLRQGLLDEAEQDLQMAWERLPPGHARYSLVAAECAVAGSDLLAAGFHVARGLDAVTAAATTEELGPLVHLLASIANASVVRIDEESRARLASSRRVLERGAGHPVVGAWHATVEAECANEAQAPAAWDIASQCWHGLGYQPMETFTTWRAGLAHRARGALAEATPRLEEAARLARPLQMKPLLDRVLSGQPPAWASISRRGTSGEAIPMRPGSAIDACALTARELEVLMLLMEGISNKAIGARLHISPRTVGSHVSSILAKLEVTSRGEAAAAAHRLGLVGAAR